MEEILAKGSPKSLALAALTDALEEATRAVSRPAVLVALLEIAREKLEAVDELKRARREPKKGKGPGADS